jgi:hypothetical protein
MKTKNNIICVFLFFEIIVCNNISEFHQNLIYQIENSEKRIKHYTQSIERSSKYSEYLTKNKNSKNYNLTESSFDKKYNELIQKVDFLSYALKNIDKEIVPLSKDKIKIDNKLILEHKNLVKKYNSKSIDKSFFNNQFLNMQQFLPNIDGFWVTNDGNRWLHVIKAYQYITPSNRTGLVKNPYNEYETVSSTLCVDARDIYESSWNKYVSTSSEKEKLLNDVMSFQKNTLKNIIKKDYEDVNNWEVLNLFLSSFQSKLDAERKNYDLIINKIIESGINISKKEKLDLGLIKTRINNFGKKIQTEYESFIDNKNKNKFFDAAYHIFSLVAIDKKKTFELGYEEAEKFSKKYLKQILNDFNKNIKIIEHGEYKGYSVDPLSQYELLVLTGLTDMILLTNFAPSEEDQFILPQVKFGEEKLSKVLSHNNIRLALKDDYDKLSNVDNTSIENTYIKQIGNSDLRLNNTDYHGFSGLFSGNKILCVDINGEIKVKIISLNTTDNWGIKTHNIKIEETTDISATEYLNIRIRRE